MKSEGEYQAGLVDPPAPGEDELEADGSLVGERPPDGYEPCPKKCGRWRPATNSLCWQCYVSKAGRADEVVKSEPDWLPVREDERSVELTVGDLVEVIRKSGLAGLKSAFMCAQVDEMDDVRAEAYKACWVALTPHANREVEAVGPDLDGAPDSLRSGGLYWRYQHFSGNVNVPGSQVVFGWTVKLGRLAAVAEKRWFKSRGYVFHGGRWCRSDEQGVVRERKA